MGFSTKRPKTRIHSAAILKRTHAPFALAYAVHGERLPKHTHEHLLCQRVNPNSKTRLHTFSALLFTLLYYLIALFQREKYFCH